MIRKLLKPFNYKSFNSLNKQIYFKYFNQPQNFSPEKDYYKILDLDKHASQSDVKKSYYKLAKQYHPDVNKGNQSRFKQISQAYQVLSNQQTKKQYDSARTFRQGWSKMGTKAQQGSYSYQEYQNVFYSMSPQQRQQFQRQAQARFRKFLMFLGGFFVFWILFSRTPHKAYTQYNGTLIPIQPQAQFHYPDPYTAQPNPYNQYGGGHTPYGQPNNPYANQPYEAPLIVGAPRSQPQQTYGSQPSYGTQPAQSYGSQYPQSQYLNQYNQYQQQPQTGYPQQQNYPPQPKSKYTVQKPQAHQPYPNSPYAQKPMQTNYQPGYKPEAPKGMED